MGKKEAAIMCDNRCQWSFDDLKCLCTMAPVLAYANFTRPFKLYYDTCGSGLGAVVYQTCDDGTDDVIIYTSRSLTKAESDYPAHKLEFLTLKWAVVDKFHEYLYGLTLDFLYRQQSPDLCFNHSQAGCCKSPMCGQFSQLQFSVVL